MFERLAVEGNLGDGLVVKPEDLAVGVVQHSRYIGKGADGIEVVSFLFHDDYFLWINSFSHLQK